MRKKLLIIGLDGATFDLIDPWIKAKKLPTLTRIINTGVKGVLKTTIPPITPCAWSSFATGKNPGKHGIYDFYFLNENLELDANSAETRLGKDFWEILSEHGKKCIVFNVPITYPPRKIDGIMISGFTTPSLKSNFTYPPEFKDLFLQKFPHYQISEDAVFTERAADQKRFLEEIKKLTNIQAEVAKWLMSNFDWDFFMVLLNSTDHAQHRYWHYLDSTHPKYEANKNLKNAILEIYQQADTMINDLCYKTAPKGTSLLIVSDHGGGPFLQNVYLNNWLSQKGYLKFKNTPRVWLKRIIRSLSINPESLTKIAWNLGVGKDVQRPALRKRTNILKKLRNLLLTFEDVDWQKTKAYSFGYYAPIYINTRERGWGGMVSEEEYPKIRKELKKQLEKLIDPETKEKIVDKIYFKEELYSGPLAKKLPDIIFPMKSYSYGSSSTFPFGSNKVFGEAMILKTGDHRENGVFLATGPEFSENKTLKDLNIIDIAPTVLEFFGIKPPRDMDGKAIKL